MSAEEGTAAGIQTAFRTAKPATDPNGRYPGFKPGTTTLTAGTVVKPGARPLACDIIFERDLAVALRDGTVVYVDVLRPAGGTDLPAVVAWSPYGKEEGNQLLDDFPFRAGVAKDAVSGLQKWEAPDPAYWCAHGYAIVNPDARGAYGSQGDVYFFGTQEGRDGCDVVEWVAAQGWCNGKVGLAGNSWLAIAQWFIAAERPPHLAAIAPWEGLNDLYRHDLVRGGIPDAGFNESIVQATYGPGRVEDLPAMVARYPLMNAYWEDKAAALEKVDVPAYVVASWTNFLHTPGTFEGFERIASAEKWLRVHNTMEWPDFYRPENQDDLRRFFDRYLRGLENGWETTPRVRLSVLDPDRTDVVDRPETEWPPARTEYRSLYLDASSGRLSPTAPTAEASVRYVADDGKGRAVFTMTCDRDMELVGYLKLRLWVEAAGADDMDVFVKVQKLDRRGRILPSPVMPPPNPLLRKLTRRLVPLGLKPLTLMYFTGAKGRIRVSHRALDQKRSTAWAPYLTHAAEERLASGDVVPVDIAVTPLGMRWRAGEQLRVIVAGYDLSPVAMKGVAPVKTLNRGAHVIHTGGTYDSHLLVPVVAG